MADPYTGEIKIISFNFPPRGWAFCNGQILPIAQNQALFSLFGTTYGGNGVTTFGLPNLQGRVPVCWDTVHGQNVLGEIGGQETHTLTSAEMPLHNHALKVRDGLGNANTPSGNVLAKAPVGLGFQYSSSPDNVAAANTTTSIGGSQPHTNMMPYLVVNFCVALVGIFPSRN